MDYLPYRRTKRGISIYITYICVVHHKVGKGGKNILKHKRNDTLTKMVFSFFFKKKKTLSEEYRYSPYIVTILNSDRYGV